MEKKISRDFALPLTSRVLVIKGRLAYKMPNQEIIDLSLSTDDESPTVHSFPSKSILSPQVHKSFKIPSYGFDSSIRLDGSFPAPPRKRRKIAPPAASSTAFNTELQTAPAPSRQLPPLVDTNENFYFSFDDDDPIVWTSPKPQNYKPSAIQPAVDAIVLADSSDSDASLPDDVGFRTAQERPEESKKLSDRTAALVANLQKPGTRIKKSAIRTDSKKSLERTGVSLSGPLQENDHRDDNVDSASSAQVVDTKLKKKSRPTEEEKAIKEKERIEAREIMKATKAKEKEELKEQKRILKEEQLREKQKQKDRVEANRLKLDKKLSTPEMIVDLPISIDNSSVDTQIREFLKQLGVEVTSYQSQVPNLIKWRRKVEARFNAEKGYREALHSKEIDAEAHVMCLMPAKEFVELATASPDKDGQDLDTHVLRIRSSFENCVPIYLIEGLDVWMRKNKNARNRAYQASVLGQADSHTQDPGGSSNATSRRKKQTADVVDEDAIEDALLRLQLTNGCLVHHAVTSIETAEWVAHFTEHISQIPYRSSALHSLAL